VIFNLHIDTPVEVRLPSPFLRLRGWSYASGVDIQGVRLHVGEHALVGKYGTARPDVLQAFPDAPHGNTGFEVRGRLPGAQCRARLEFQLGDGSWHQAKELALSSPCVRLPWWLSGGNAADIVAFQLPSSATHAPRPLRAEHFPKRSAEVTALRMTIVTPSFNQGAYLKQTIHSVDSQGSGTIDYIVQDGGSTDISSKIIADGRALGRPWRYEADAGQADAIANAFSGLAGHKGDIMAWINSDDFYLPGAIDYVADYFSHHPDVDVVYGHRVLVDEQSREIGRWFLPPHDDEVLRLNDFVPQETMFWRRRIWDKVGGIDTSFKFAMDWDLLLRFQAAGAKIVRVPYFLACFRIHSAQKTSAQMESVGQKEIDALRLRTFGRVLSPQEIESNPRLLRYLRKSAWIEFLWRWFRIRHH
jgi:glycosyltransferase involved in cell wall biosynthesis